MSNGEYRADAKKSADVAVVVDFGQMGRITKENLDSVFDNDLTALARRRREKRMR